MSAPRRQDRIRQRLVLVSIVLLVPIVGVGALTDLLPWQATAWMAGFSVLTVMLSLVRKTPLARARLLLVPMGVAVGPWVCAANGAGAVNLAVSALIPVVLAMLFIESFLTVLFTVLAGLGSLCLWYVHAGLSVQEVAMIMVSATGVGVLLVMTSWNGRRVRELDRETEAEHNQALRLSESRRAQAERLAIVGRLASGVAHEINNPLAFVKANVGTLRRALMDGETLPPDELQESLGATAQGIARSCQIVADLKGFSREDQGVLEPVDVRDVVSGAVRLAHVRLPRDVKVLMNLPSRVPLVRASPRKLAQVLLNLLVNAGDALEEAKTPRPHVAIGASIEGEFLRLTVTDNGAGIPEDILPRMFEPFFTTKPVGKGTGLGLALSREYVESFGGTIAVRNVEPRGAEFSVNLRITAVTGETPLPGSMDAEVAAAPMMVRRRSTG